MLDVLGVFLLGESENLGSSECNDYVIRQFRRLYSPHVGHSRQLTHGKARRYGCPRTRRHARCALFAAPASKRHSCTQLGYPTFLKATAA